MILELAARNINYSYIPGQTVLHDVSLSLKAGEILYLLGPNGGGKTTLLSCMAGLLQPESGQILLDKQPLGHFTAAERAQRIGFIPQIHVSAFGYSVKEMVSMGRAPHLKWLAMPSQEDDRIVEQALEQVGITELQNRAYTEISGGERQLVLIARGLAQHCNILLMDEPTAHLDLSNQYRVLEIIQNLAKQGLSFIISSHAPNDALAYGDQVLLLSGGWVTEYGKPNDILNETALSIVYGIQTEVIYGSMGGGLIPRAVVPRRPSFIAPESLNDPESLLTKVFEKGNDIPQIIVMTGLSGAGKTTWCQKLEKAVRQQGKAVRGVISPGVYKEDKKIGINLRDLKRGEERELAVLRKPDDMGISTPRWKFSKETLDWGNNILKNTEFSDLLIIDELGPLEYLRGEGLVEGLKVIDSRMFRVAVVVVRSSLLPKALQRWPESLVVSSNLD